MTRKFYILFMYYTYYVYDLSTKLSDTMNNINNTLKELTKAILKLAEKR